MVRFLVRVVSDTVCPWCYVGKKRLEKGIAAYKAKHAAAADADADAFEVEWLPFYLQPDAPATGVDKAQRYRERFGEERARAIFDRLARVGKEEGIAFRFGGKTGHTRDSHRLIRLAKAEGEKRGGEAAGRLLQDRVVSELFAAYFEHEADITSREVLRAAGERAGLDGGEVEAVLAGDRFGDEVDAEVAEAGRRGVHSVPTFSVNGLIEIPGAIEPEGFVEIFEKVKAVLEDAARTTNLI